MDDEAHQQLISYGLEFTDWVREKIELVPVIKPLVLLVKRLLYNHGLNIPFYGILSLY